MIWWIIYFLLILPTLFCYMLLLKEGISTFVDFLRNTESLISVLIEFFEYFIVFIILFIFAIVPFVNFLMYFAVFECEIKNPFYKGEK